MPPAGGATIASGPVIQAPLRPAQPGAPAPVGVPTPLPPASADSLPLGRTPAKVFVGKIPPEVPDDLIKSMLSACGKVTEWNRKAGQDGKLKAFGYCEFSNFEATVRALKHLNGYKLGSGELIVKTDSKTQEELNKYDIALKRELLGKTNAAEISGKTDEEILAMDNPARRVADEEAMKAIKMAVERELGREGPIVVDDEELVDIDPEKRGTVKSEIEHFRDRLAKKEAARRKKILEDKEKEEERQKRKKEREEREEKERAMEKEKEGSGDGEKTKDDRDRRRDHSRRSRSPRRSSRSPRRRHSRRSNSRERDYRRRGRDRYRRRYDSEDSDDERRRRRSRHGRRSSRSPSRSPRRRRDSRDRSETRRSPAREEEGQKESVEQQPPLPDGPPPLPLDTLPIARDSARVGISLKKALPKKGAAMVFQADDEGEEEGDGTSKKRKLIPIEYTEEELKAASRETCPDGLIVTLADGTKFIIKDDSDTDEARKARQKNLADCLPTRKDKMFSFRIDWTTLERANILEKKMKPWVGKKVAEYAGEEIEEFRDFVLSHIGKRTPPAKLVEEVGAFLDDVAEEFVMKVWRMLLFEVESERLRL